VAQREQKLKDSNQASMFDLFGANVPTPMPALELITLPNPIPLAELLTWEKELLGIYVSEHPFQASAAQLAPLTSALISEINADMGARELALAGMVTSVRPLLTKDGRNFCAVEIEDLSGSIEITVWSDVYEVTKDLWQPGTILLLVARLRPREDRLNISVLRAKRHTPDSDPADLEGFGVESVGVASGNGEQQSGRSNGNYPRPAGRDRPNGNQREPGPQPRRPAASHFPLRIEIELRETDDEAADRRRLSEVVKLLNAAPGQDETRLILHTESEDVVLQAPSIDLTESLEARLNAAIGSSGSISTTAQAGRREAPAEAGERELAQQAV
jgi:DNA polymerase-3 subunit alpha